MTKSKWLTKKIIQDLYYKQGFSALEVGQKFGKGYSQVYKFMRRHNMPRRTPAQTKTIQFYKSPFSYSKKQVLSFQETKLLNATLMLYWAEGYKAGKMMDFVNSDPKMISIFVRCMRKIYRVSESRFSIQLYCYANQNPSNLISFWSNLASIPTNQFIKPYVRHNFKLKKTHKMPHGVVHIRYSDRRLYEQIMRDIDKICSDLSRNGRAVKYTSL